MGFDDSIVQLVRETLVIVLKVAAPILASGMAVGLLVSLVQSVTSIQDQTLTFVPKIFVMIVVAAVLLPWIAHRLAEYAQTMFQLGI